MIDRFEKIAYSQPDKEGSPKVDLPEEVKLNIDTLQRRVNELLKANRKLSGTEMLLQYTELDNLDPFERRIMTFIARRVDVVEDFKSQPCAKNARCGHARAKEIINKSLAIAERLGMKVIQPLQINDPKFGSHYLVYMPADPNKEVEEPDPEDFKFKRNVGYHISKGIDFIPPRCQEILFHLYMNSKNAQLLTYKQLSELTGNSEETIRTIIQELEKLLPKVSLQIFKAKAKSYNRLYFGVSMLNGGKSLLLAFNQLEAKKTQKIQRKRERAKKQKEANKGPRVTSRQLITKNFKRPHPSDEVYYYKATGEDFEVLDENIQDNEGNEDEI